MHSTRLPRMAAASSTVIGDAASMTVAFGLTRAMLAWAGDGDMWKRRSAILCQLGAKAETDLALLEAAIAPSLGSKEFFLRKAIGWALRQYARTDPAWVAAYVAAHDAELSPLSKREALKHIAAA